MRENTKWIVQLQSPTDPLIPNRGRAFCCREIEG